MKKVIILNSPLFRETNTLYDEDSLPPLGLGYIATNLQDNGIEVELVDAVYDRIPLVSIVHKLKASKPNFIASNVFSTNFKLVKEIIESIDFSTHFIIGGLSTKQLYNEIIEWNTKNPIDIVTGDGEYITLAIVRGDIKQQPIKQLDNRRVFCVTKGSPYEVKDISSVRLNRRFFKNEPVKHPLGFIEANIVASRGCIYNCAFCAAARSLNRDYSVRERTVESLQNELEEITELFPEVTSIRVLDDLFLKNNASIEHATEVFSPFNLSWRSMAHVMTFKKASLEAVRKLKKSGCHELFIGIESGSPRILSQINKTKDISLIINNLNKVLQAEINIKGYFIYGFPGEREEDMEMTLTLAQLLKNAASSYGVNFRTSVFQYRPYHGTQIYHDLQKGGKDTDVENIQANKELSDLVGRIQFNFHSGNFSQVDSAVLNDYIYRTTNLNNGHVFGELRPKAPA